jgi:hypothetical protein
MLGLNASALMARAVTKLVRQMPGVETKNIVNMILQRQIRIKV